MGSNHGWTEASLRNYEQDKARRAMDAEIRAFRERATMIAAHYAGDPKGYDVEYANHCLDHEHLADEVTEIREFLDTRE